MTFVPLLVGIILGGSSWWQALLTFTWTAAFFSFHAFGLWAKARMRKRFRAPTFTYGSIAAVGALALVIKHPFLLSWALPFTLLFSVVVWQVIRRNERSLSARLSEIFASSLMIPVASSLGSHPATTKTLVIATILIAAYFSGTVPYVKTLIRERTSSKWLRASITYHFLGLILTTVSFALGYLHLLVAISWLVLLLRAYLYPTWSKRREKEGHGPLSPAIIGVSEFAFCALVLISVVTNFN